jgi:hypothetical protein
MADIPVGRKTRRQGRIVRWNGKRWVPATKAKTIPKSNTPSKTTQTKFKPSARRANAAAKAERAAQGTKSKGVRTGEPKGAANRYYGAKRVNAAVRRAKISTAARSAASTGGSLAAQSAGMYIAGKLAETIGKKGQSRMSRLGIQGSAKPVGQSSKNKKKPTATKPPTSKSGLSNIPKKEGTGKEVEKKYQYGAYAPKPKTTSTPKTKPKPKTAKERAYAADARNKEYDKLRKAGKIKEAEKLGKQIAADARKKAPKNPFRAPQGAERKDRLSKQVAELKAMGKKKEKEKKKQSKANKAGWPGNRNF